MNLPALLLLTTLVAAPDAEVLVRSDHAEVVIGKEHYRLVTREAPLRAVVMNSTGRKRLVINVIRIGEEGDDNRGGTPLKVKVGRRSHVFPNRPSLVDKRRVTRLGEGLIASFPVRYPMRLKRGRQVPIRISLRRPEKGGRVGVLLTLEDPQDTLLTPLSPQGEAVASGSVEKKAKKRAAKRARRRTRARRQISTADRANTGGSSSSAERGEPKQAPKPPATETDPASVDEPPARDAQGEGQAIDEPAKVASAQRSAPADAGEPEAPASPDAGAPIDDSARTVDAGALLAGAPAPPPAHPTPSSGRLKVTVRDQMGGSFVLDVAEVSIDGRPVVGGPSAGQQRELFNGALRPGRHEVQVHLAYRVDAGWFFSYLEGYTFHLSEGAWVDLEAGDDVRVEVVGEQVGGWFAEMEDKPSIRVRVQRR